MRLALTACSAIVGETPVETIEAGTTTTFVTTTTVTTTSTTTAPAPAPRDCTPVRTGTAPVTAGSVAGVALLLSAEIFPCADDVVVVPETNLNEVATAAQLAAAWAAPCSTLTPNWPQIGAAQTAQGPPDRGDRVDHTRDSEVLRPDTSRAVEMAGRALDVSEEIRLPAMPDTSTIVETIGALTHRDRVVLPQTTPPVTPTTAPVPPVIDRAAMIKGLGCSLRLGVCLDGAGGQTLVALRLQRRVVPSAHR